MRRATGSAYAYYAWTYDAAGYPLAYYAYTQEA